MKLLFGICLMLLMTPGTMLLAQEGDKGFNKRVFYVAMAGKDKAAVEDQLELLKTVSVSGKDAFEGALLMKQAGLIGGPKKKLDMFKRGHKKLEAVLKKDSSNTEYRFLRLMIQENAPGILGYKGEMEKDKIFIKNNFKKLQPVVQDAVQQYAKESRILKSADL